MEVDVRLECDIEFVDRYQPIFRSNLLCPSLLYGVLYQSSRYSSFSREDVHIRFLRNLSSK